MDLLDSSIVRYATDIVGVKFKVFSACRIIINTRVFIQKLLYVSWNRHGFCLNRDVDDDWDPAQAIRGHVIQQQLISARSAPSASLGNFKLVMPIMISCRTSDDLTRRLDLFTGFPDRVSMLDPSNLA